MGKIKSFIQRITAKKVESGQLGGVIKTPTEESKSSGGYVSTTKPTVPGAYQGTASQQQAQRSYSGGGGSSGNGGTTLPMSTLKTPTISVQQFRNIKSASNIQRQRLIQNRAKAIIKQRQNFLTNLKRQVYISPQRKENIRKAFINFKRSNKPQALQNIQNLDIALKKLDEQLTKGISKEQTKRARTSGGIERGGKSFPLVLSNIKSTGYSIARPIVRTGKAGTTLILKSPNIIKKIPKAPKSIKNFINNKVKSKDWRKLQGFKLKSWGKRQVTLLKESPTSYIASVGTEVFLLKGTGKALKVTGKLSEQTSALLSPKFKGYARTGKSINVEGTKITFAGKLGGKYLPKMTLKEQARLSGKRINAVSFFNNLFSLDVSLLFNLLEDNFFNNLLVSGLIIFPTLASIIGTFLPLTKITPTFLLLFIISPGAKVTSASPDKKPTGLNLPDCFI